MYREPLRKLVGQLELDDNPVISEVLTIPEVLFYLPGEKTEKQTLRGSSWQQTSRNFDP